MTATTWYAFGVPVWGSRVAAYVRDTLRALWRFLMGRGQLRVRRMIEVENSETHEVMQVPVFLPVHKSEADQRRIARAELRRMRKRARPQGYYA